MNDNLETVVNSFKSEDFFNMITAVQQTKFEQKYKINLIQKIYDLQEEWTNMK